MFMNLLVVVFVLGVTYTWCVRGVFNSMIHALCVLFAGAIAFALWEPLANLLLGISDAAIIEATAWGIALILPFVICTLLFRVVTDKVIASTIKNTKAIDYGLGAVFGAISSVITAGVLVIGIGYMRLPSTFLGYQPVWYASDRAGAGSLVENSGLWIPVDTVTAMVYSNLSTGSMSSGEPLKKWYPDLTLTGFASRVSPGDGAARNTFTTDAFSLLSSYTVGNPNGSTEQEDTLGSQGYFMINGENPGSGYIAGYVIEFGPEAKERGGKGGQVVVSNGQIRMLTQAADGSTATIFPVATISESTEQGMYGRWVYDGDDVFITSTGGKSRVQMGFEFFVPTDQTPIALYVKNARISLDGVDDPQEFANAAQRDSLVLEGDLLTGNRIKRALDLSNAIVIDTNESQIDTRVTDTLGTVISSQTAKQRGLNLNEDNQITEGTATFSTEFEVGRNNAPPDKNLRVEKIAFGRGQLLVQIDMGSDAAAGLLSEAANQASGDDPFLLIDSNDNEYEAVGYVFEDASTNLFKFRYTPGDTLSGMNESEFPRISRSKDGQELRLLFLVSSQIEIKYMTIGNVVLHEYDPMIIRD